MPGSLARSRWLRRSWLDRVCPAMDRLAARLERLVRRGPDPFRRQPDCVSDAIILARRLVQWCPAGPSAADTELLVRFYVDRWSVGALFAHVARWERAVSKPRGDRP